MSFQDSSQQNFNSNSFICSACSIRPGIREKKQLLRELISKLVRRMKQDSNVDKYTSSSVGFTQNVDRGALACFAQLCQVLACSPRVIDLNFAGCNINTYYAIELANLIRVNRNIESLNLAGCNMNSFSLSCIFKAMIDRTGLRVLNLFNNQNFTYTAVQDLCKYVLKGQNQLDELNLSYCNIENYLIAIIISNLVHLKSLRRLKLGMMYFQSECILALGGAMLEYTGDRSLDYLDISSNRIKSVGIQLLYGALFISVRAINIKSINLANNCIDQEGVPDLESILLKIKNLQELNLMRNKIVEFQNNHFLAMKLIKINLSRNRIQEIPINFFLNVLSIDLSDNQISTQGAYQISQILSSDKVRWMELNLGDNRIMTKGFMSIIYALVDNKTLINLSVANNQIKGEGILVLICNHEQLSLQCINLSQNILRYDLVYSLITMLRTCKLKSIILSNLRQEEGQVTLGKKMHFIISCDQLRELGFQGNPKIISPILESLGTTHNHIEYLNLSNCSINKIDDISRLARIIQKSCTLHTLILACNNLGIMQDISYKELDFAFSKSQSLNYIDLSGNKLKHNIVKLINGLRNCVYLKSLDLSNNLIDDNSEFAKNIGLLLKNRCLLSINFTRNQIKTTTLLSFKSACRETRCFPQLILQNQRITADDLPALTEIFQEYTLKSLNISGNIQIDELYNVLNVQTGERIESLFINKILFRKDTFHNLLSLIHTNRRYLKTIEITGVLLSKNQLIQLLNAIQAVTYLLALTIDYQVFEKMETVDALVQLLPNLLHLKHLNIRKSLLTFQFYNFIKTLLSESFQLSELDLSDNKISTDCVKELNKGIKQTTTLQVLNLSNCQLTDKSFKFLMTGLTRNKTIQQLDISQNHISIASQELLCQILQESKIKWLRLSKNKGNIFTFLLNESKLSNIKLQILDLSKNQFQISSMQDIIFKFSSLFANMRHLNLEECQLEDEHCQFICQLISSNTQDKLPTQLNKLILRKNLITSAGFKLIFESVMKYSNRLELLDISSNQITGNLTEAMVAINDMTSKNLKLLLLDGNSITGDYNYILQILQTSPKLYIFNRWKNINDQLALAIVQSYTRFTVDYNFTNNVPYYISELFIDESNLTDEFITWFGVNFFKFPYIKTLSFNRNYNITSRGKTILYANIISKNYQNFNLSEVYFDDRHSHPSFFDDGFLRYCLIKMKFNLQNDNGEDNRYLDIFNNIKTQKEVENIKWGSAGKWIIHLINKLLVLVQNINITQFRISNKLQIFIINRLFEIKCHLIYSIVSEVARFGLSLALLALHDYYMDFHDENCKKSFCMLKDLETHIVIPFVVNFILIFIHTTGSLIDSIRIRRRSLPNYCVVTSDMNHFVKSMWPTKRELILFIGQIFCQQLYLGEFFVIGQLITYYRYVKSTDNPTIDKEQLLSRFLQLIIIFGLHVTYKFVLSIYMKVKYTIQMIKCDQYVEHTYFYGLIWLIALHDNNHLVGNAFTPYCPQSGIVIRNTLYNRKQVFEVIYFVTFEFVSFLLYNMFYHTRQQFSHYLGYDATTSQAMLLFSVIPVLCFLKMIYHAFIALTCRPPEVRVSDCNEALLARKYEQMTHTKTLTTLRPQKRSKQEPPLRIAEEITFFRKQSIDEFWTSQNDFGIEGDPMRIPLNVNNQALREQNRND